METKTIRELLRELVEKGWTLTSVAERLGVGRNSVSTWANGRRTPNAAVTVALKSLLSEEPVGKRKPRKESTA